MAIATEYLFDIAELQPLIAKLLTPSTSKAQTPCYLANSQVNVTNIPFYATLGYVTQVKQGTSRKQLEGEKEEVTTVYNTTLSLHIIGKNAIMWASRLDASLRLSSSTQELNRLGLGVLTISPIRDLSLPLDGGYEQRAQIDITLWQKTTIIEQHNEMRSVDFVMEIER